MKISEYLHAFYQQSSHIAPRIVIGIVVFLLVWLTAIVAKHIIVKMADHSESRKYLLRLLGQAIKTTIILIGLVCGLGTMGINVTALVTSLGLVGFALGFALKDSLSNLIAGFMLLFYHPFQVNDTIAVSSIEGTVVDINLRYTVIHTETETHMVPNATLINNIVT
jgi:small conductance mechanosensitive channel